jgi:hypothetical protein
MVGGVGCTCTLSHRSAQRAKQRLSSSGPDIISSHGESLTAERGHESFAGDKTEAISCSRAGLARAIGPSTAHIFEWYRVTVLQFADLVSSEGEHRPRRHIYACCMSVAQSSDQKLV